MILSPAAERIIQQQQEQINKMTEQIQQLQETLKTFQNTQMHANQSQCSYPLSPQSQSQIIQNPPPLPFSHRDPNSMYKNYPQPPPYYYYNQYPYYPHPQMGPHQYPPYMPMQDHPYNMYHRAPYYMQESFVSGDGKSRRGDLNNFPVDAISDIQSIKKEDDVQSEVSNQIVFNNFHAQLKNGNIQLPQDEQLSFAQNNIHMFQNTLTQRALDQQNNNSQTQQNMQLINQSGQSAKSLQIMKQNSFQSSNNMSMQEQQNNLNNGNRKQSREDFIAQQIYQQNNQFTNENTFQYKENQDGNLSIRSIRKSEIQFDSSDQYQTEKYERRISNESQQEQQQKYSPNLYFGDEQKNLKNKQSFETFISARPSVDQSPYYNDNKGENNLEKIQSQQIKINSFKSEQNQQIQNNYQTQKESPDYNQEDKNEYSIKQSPKKINDHNIRQIKNAMENMKQNNLENEETFTIDSKVNFKMNLDFLNSVRKTDENNNSICNNKENKNNLNMANNTKNIVKKSNIPLPSSHQRQQSNHKDQKENKSKIPTIKYEQYCDSDTSDDDMQVKELEKKYFNNY